MCLLASRSKPENAREFIPKDGAGGDAGVECYWKLIDGSEHVWQAKYFLDRLGNSQWKQIDGSVVTALSKHPKLTKYYVCLPKDRTDIRRVNRNGKPVLSELDRWNHYVTKWTALAAKKSMEVEFVFWGKLQITSLILQSEPGNLANLTNYWFGTIDGTTDAWPHWRYPTDLVDREIKKATDTLRKSRFFPEFDRVRASLTLARKLAEGDLIGGTDEVRSHALAWCVRLLARNEELDKAEKYLDLAKELGTSEEIGIAEAFVASQKEDESTALRKLAGIKSTNARSAAFMIVTNHRGQQKALDWLESTKISVTELDTDGKYHLLKTHLELGNWVYAQKVAEALTEDDMGCAPILHHMSAVTHLLKAVPNELASSVSKHPPVTMAGIYTLAGDAAAIAARRRACHNFSRAADVAFQLGCPQIANVDDMYAIWLEVMDPDESEKGRNRLEAKLRDTNAALYFVLYGVAFNIKLDTEVIERQINRQIELNGGVPFEAAIARYALAYMQETSEACANYIATYRDELSVHFEEKSIHWMLIEIYASAALPDRAKGILDEMIARGLSDSEENRIRSIIAEAEGADPVKSREAIFKESNSLSDLAILVGELYDKEDWDGVCKYGTILFERTCTVTDAERIGLALYNTQQYERLKKFLESNETLLPQSNQLRMLHCLSLYYEGELLEARSKLEELEDIWDHPYCRELRVNIGISLGDWNSLSSVIAHECANMDARTPEDLIRTAQLAFHLDSPQSQVKELTFTAVNKANDNANVLAGAYFLATIAGWENTEEVADWLQRAASLSGDNGPIRRATIQEFIDQKPAWDRIQSEVLTKLRRGEMPMFGAGHALNRSLIEIMTYPFYVNMTETDLRRGDAVLAYSGKKRHTSIDRGGKTAMDVSALLTLGSLDILDIVLDTFEVVHVSHSTLGWFFVERKKAMFHQPSRIRDARQIRDFLNEGALEKLTCDGVAQDDLADQIGDELAQLITVAEDAENEDSHHCLVICPYPVTRAGSLMDEEADLTGHAKVLSSCVSVVKELQRKGWITKPEERHARAYLKLHEKPWPDQPEIADGATLYLTNLATTYFQHLGLLEKLKVAGFRTVVSPGVVSEVDQLISFGNISGKIETTIERICSALRTRLANGKVKTDRILGSDKPITTSDKPTEQSIPDHPTLGVISLANQYDTIVIDDRFISLQFPHIIAESTVTPVISSLDVIDAFASSCSITEEDRMEYRTILRKAGYILVPVEVDELIHHLESSTVENGEVVETAGLKAIRENLLLVRLSGCVLSSGKDDWFRMLYRTFRDTLEKLWKAGGDLLDVKARSDWILSQMDLQNWAHCFDKETGEHMVGHGYGAHIMSLLLLPIEGLQEVKEDYWKWIEDRVLDPIREQHPDRYIELVDWYRGFVQAQVDRYVNENTGNGNGSSLKSAVAQATISYMPPLICKELLQDSSFRDEYGIDLSSKIDVGGISFELTNLTVAVRSVLSDSTNAEVIDTDERKWQLKNISGVGELPKLVISGDEELLLPPSFISFSPNKKTRLRCFDEAVNDVNLPSSASDKWREILSSRALIDEEIYELNGEFRNTPIATTEALINEITAGNSPISTLVPPSRVYFERLVGKYDGSPTVRAYAAGAAKSLFGQLSEWRSYEGFLHSLLVSSHSSLTDEVDVSKLSSEELVKAYEFLVAYGDRISQLGAIEVGLRVLPSRPELEKSLISLIEQIRDDNVEETTSAFRLFSTLFCLVDGELARIRLLSDTPPFYRRLAAMSQASLIHRQLVISSVETDRFCDMMPNDRRFQHFLQSLTDMRQEPRWDPRFAAESQIKSEFVGRIIIAADRFRDTLENCQVRSLLYTEEAASLRTYSQLFYSYLPGPLEGMENPQARLPSEFAEITKNQLSANSAEPSSFVALVNFGLVFGLTEELSELAVHTLSSASYRLRNIENREQLVATLYGLASIAAATRNTALADALRIVVRIYRADARFKLSIQESTNICLAAAASRSELNAWTEYVGECMTELAFGKLQGDEGLECYAYLIGLCHSVPELWVTCGRADAALLAFNSK